jgi:hypothetical protein
MATVDTVKTALINKLETSITSASPEQLAYIAKAVNSIEPPIAWASQDSSFSGVNYSGYFVNTTDGEVTVTLPNVGGNTVIAPYGTDKILGQDSDILVDTMGIGLQLVWSGDTNGWQFLVQG